MKRKQTHFLVAPPAFFGGAPIFIAYDRDLGPSGSEASDASGEEDERKSEHSWIRSALTRALGMAKVLQIPRSKRRLRQQRVGT